MIEGLIQRRGFELVRDRIGQILVSEFENQLSISDQLPDSDADKLPFIEPITYVERFRRIDSNEVSVKPLVNVMNSTGDYDSKSMADSDAEHTYFIDAYLTKKGVDGSKALFNLQRLLGLIRGVLSNPEYRTLLFPPGLIQSVRCNNIAIRQPEQETTDNAVMGRVNFVVKFTQDENLKTPEQWVDSAITNVTLGETSEGYIYEYNRN